MCLCSVCSIKPSPPSATTISAEAGSQLPYMSDSCASACWASAPALATKAIRSYRLERVIGLKARAGVDEGGSAGGRLYDRGHGCRDRQARPRYYSKCNGIGHLAVWHG